LKHVAIHSAWPKSDTFQSILPRLIENLYGCAQVHGGPVVTDAKNLPNVGRQGSQTIVTKISGQIRVIRDDQRQVKSTAPGPAAVIESGDTKQGGVCHMKNVGPKLDQDFADRGARECQAKLRIKEERRGFHSYYPAMLEFISPAIRCKDQDLMPESPELLHCLAQGGNDAVSFWYEGLGEKGNSHLLGSMAFQLELTESTTVIMGGLRRWFAVPECANITTVQARYVSVQQRGHRVRLLKCHKQSRDDLLFFHRNAQGQSPSPNILPFDLMVHFGRRSIVFFLFPDLATMKRSVH
jgi:hypothetical protein